MKEIGGYFELDSFNCNQEYYDGLALNSGRNALAYIIRSRNIKKIYLPHYICDSVKNTCFSHNVAILFYRLTESLEPNFDDIRDPDIFLYLVNYFGLISNKRIRIISKMQKNIIVDNVQAFFQKPIKGIDTIYSCRKFFGVPDGAYLFTSSYLQEKLPIDDSSNRLLHLKGRRDSCAKDYYESYLKNEKCIDSLPLMEMSLTTRDLLKRIDYSKCKRQRTKNFNTLNRYLRHINQMTCFDSIPGAFAYPLLVKDGDKLRKALISKNIYVPLLWPNTNEKQATCLAENLLPIPCDYRYKRKDMLFIIKCIFEYEN